MWEMIAKGVPAVALCAVLLAAPSAMADHRQDDDGQHILIRRTIPYPQAVKRAPLTSDRLSTTSTRLIDARRGLRPYSTVHRHHPRVNHRVIVGYDDHFGITRPENRPYSYSRRAPYTGVTRFENKTATEPARAGHAPSQALPIVVVVRDERDAPAKQPAPDMRIRIHNDKPALPSRSGAVLITADGTVIQVGD